MMLESRSCGFFTVILCSVTAVLAQQNGGSYTCDPSSWTDGKKFTVTFRIDRSKFPSLCTREDGLVSFENSQDGTAYKTNCTVTDKIQNNCSFIPGTLGCGCTASDEGGLYVTEYNFIAGPDYGRWWRARVGCVDKNTIAQALSFSGSCGQNPPPPEGGFYEGKSSSGDDGEPFFKISFRIYRSKYPVMCTGGTDGLPQFHSSPADGTFTTKCTVDVDIRTNGSCSFTPGTLGCGCTESNDDYYNMEYNSISDFEKDTIWIATISCLDAHTQNQALTFSGDGNITDVECGFCDLQCGYIGEHKGCIAFIAVLCSVSTAAILLIVVRICYRCCRNQIKKRLTCTRFFRGVEYIVCCGCCDPCCRSNCGLGDTAAPSEEDETWPPVTRSRVVPQPSPEEGYYNMTVSGTPRSLRPLHNQANAIPASPRKESLSDSKKQKLPSINSSNK